MILEKDLEDMIYCADPEDLRKAGLPAWKNLTQQVRIGNYGIADLINFEIIDVLKDVIIVKTTIIELKQGKVGEEAFFQALRYSKGIQELYCKKISKEKKVYFRDFEIVLIGNRVDTRSNLIYLSDICSNVSFYSTQITLNGIEFKSELAYKLTEGGEISEDSLSCLQEEWDIMTDSFNFEGFENDKKLLQEYLGK
jgi:hypothetical protein